MDIIVGDRLLIKDSDGKLREIKVIEIQGDYIKMIGWYPDWQRKDDIHIIEKLSKKEKDKGYDICVETAGRECPLFKKVCGEYCAWFQKSRKACILLNMAMNIEIAVEDDT